MFEDDEDLNFDDENFLNEVFAVAEASCTNRGQEGAAGNESSNENLFSLRKESQNSLRNVNLKNKNETHYVRSSVSDKANVDKGNSFEDDFTDDFDECFSEQTITNLEQKIFDQEDCVSVSDSKVTECVKSTTKEKNCLVKEHRQSKYDSLEGQYQNEKNQSSVSWKRRRSSSVEKEQNVHCVKRYSSESGKQGAAVQAEDSSEDKNSKEWGFLSSSHNKNNFKSIRAQDVEKTVTSPQGQHVQQRRFPGPAGLLPKLGGTKEGKQVQTIVREKVSPSVSSENLICSQSSACDFYQGAWQQMVEDLDFNESNPKCPLSVFNIRWVLKRAALRGQAALRKVPFLAVLVKSLDLTHTHATAVFRDKTGEMNGTIASQVLEEHLGNIQAGDLLVLRNVTLLSPIGIRKCLGGRDLHKKHYLNVTANAIVMVYHRSESGGFHATALSELNLEEVLQEAATPRSSSGRRSVIEEEEEEEAMLQGREGAHEQVGLYSNFYNTNSSYHNAGNSKFYNSGNSSYYNAPNRRENNARMMSPILPMRNQGSAMQPIRPQRLPFANASQSPSSQGHMRPPEFLRNSALAASPYRSPVISIPSVVCKPATPNNAAPEISQSSTGSGKGKFVFQPKVASTGVQQKSFLDDTHPEIDHLLDGIDEDSLFGDF